MSAESDEFAARPSGSALEDAEYDPMFMAAADGVAGLLGTAQTVAQQTAAVDAECHVLLNEYDLLVQARVQDRLGWSTPPSPVLSE